MKVRLRFFSALREAVGQTDWTREVPDGATVGDLVQTLMDEFPRFAAASGRMYVALNRKHAERSAPLADGDEVAFFPPVSGGADAPQPPRFAFVDGPLSADDAAARVAAPEHGAITTFLGIVRDHTGDRKVNYLEYEAYEEMAVPLLERVGAEIRQRWPSIRAVCILHRTGRLEIGEASIVIAVAASHRQETFDACHYAIDRVKAIVPIWKKEVWTDGSQWIEGPRQPDATLTEAWSGVQPFQPGQA